MRIFPLFFKIEWVNDYHASCLAKLGPILNERRKTETLAWLQKACAKL